MYLIQVIKLQTFQNKYVKLNFSSCWPVGGLAFWASQSKGEWLVKVKISQDIFKETKVDIDR